MKGVLIKKKIIICESQFSTYRKLNKLGRWIYLIKAKIDWNIVLKNYKKMKKLTILIIISMGMFFLTPSVRGASYSNTYTGFLVSGNFAIVTTNIFETGDKVYWDFRTFDNPFNMMLIAGPNILSIDSTSGSGSFSVPAIIPYLISIYNVDTTESGNYEVNISVNPPASIPGFNLFILLGIVGLTAIIIKRKLNLT